MGGCREDGARLSSVVSSESTRSNGHKLKYRKFNLKLFLPFFFFKLRMSRNTGTGCREVVKFLSLQILKTQLRALSNLL